MSSAPKTPASTVVALRLKGLCPEVYSGNGGVAIRRDRFGSVSVSGLLSVLASRIAVQGQPGQPTDFYPARTRRLERFSSRVRA
jgi:hypothetical protein